MSETNRRSYENLAALVKRTSAESRNVGCLLSPGCLVGMAVVAASSVQRACQLLNFGVAVGFRLPVLPCDDYLLSIV